MPKPSKGFVVTIKISVIAAIVGLGFSANAQYVDDRLVVLDVDVDIPGLLDLDVDLRIGEDPVSQQPKPVFVDNASCSWRGTAPSCAGACQTGEVEIVRHNCVGGACCSTGSTKAYCCKQASAPSSPAPSSPAPTYPSCAPPVGTKIGLKADTGKWLARCNGCQKTFGNKFPDTITVHGGSAAGVAVFTVVDAGAGKVGLKADNGKYLARCNGCIIGAPPDMLTVHATTPNPIKFEKLTNGKCVLKADNGKYLGRCRNCSPVSSQPDTVAIHGTDPNKPYFQFEVTRVP